MAAGATSTVGGSLPGEVAAAHATIDCVPVRTGRVTIEGDDLYFEVRGSGPPVLMIAGAQGDAGFYTAPAALLADEFPVITYDRRGNSRSTRRVTRFDITQQARDAVAVLRAAGHDSAMVFGNSAGAIIALEMAARFPRSVRAVIAHEPPILTMEPDRRYLAFFGAVDRMARLLGPEAGMLMFSVSVGIPFTAFGAIPADFTARVAENQAFFIQHEMAGFISYRPDIAALVSGGVPSSCRRSARRPRPPTVTTAGPRPCSPRGSARRR